MDESPAPEEPDRFIEIVQHVASREDTLHVSPLGSILTESLGETLSLPGETFGQRPILNAAMSSTSVVLTEPSWVGVEGVPLPSSPLQVLEGSSGLGATRETESMGVSREAVHTSPGGGAQESRRLHGAIDSGVATTVQSPATVPPREVNEQARESDRILQEWMGTSSQTCMGPATGNLARPQFSGDSSVQGSQQTLEPPVAAPSETTIDPAVICRQPQPEHHNGVNHQELQQPIAAPPRPSTGSEMGMFGQLGTRYHEDMRGLEPSIARSSQPTPGQAMTVTSQPSMGPSANVSGQQQLRGGIRDSVQGEQSGVSANVRNEAVPEVLAGLQGQSMMSAPPAPHLRTAPSGEQGIPAPIAPDETVLDQRPQSAMPGPRVPPVGDYAPVQRPYRPRASRSAPRPPPAAVASEPQQEDTHPTSSSGAASVASLPTIGAPVPQLEAAPSGSQMRTIPPAQLLGMPLPTPPSVPWIAPYTSTSIAFAATSPQEAPSSSTTIDAILQRELDELNARTEDQSAPNTPAPARTDDAWVIQDHIEINTANPNTFHARWVDQAYGRDQAIEKMNGVLHVDPPAGVPFADLDIFRRREGLQIVRYRGEALGIRYRFLAECGRVRRLWVRPWNL
ncbi:hypothetical protein PRZ48_011777 [Zasmidium cellare]|uniref:Uncharacterized protein n=1 Tax=Zasmidium cellare TaxID=395010 RepID=A0ABR0E7B0_ZASCE|nr:hypothetical protein PRZ48_011777 [Zasmidium cellare]